MTDLGPHQPPIDAEYVEDLERRYAEAVELLKRLGAHLHGECWCGEVHSAIGEPWK